MRKVIGSHGSARARMTTAWPINSNEDGEPLLAGALSVLLFAGILTLWVPDRWAVSLFQAGAFALAIAWALRFLIRPYRIQGSVVLILLAATVLWGLAQLALAQTVYRSDTWTELLKLTTN